MGRAAPQFLPTYFPLASPSAPTAVHKRTLSIGSSIFFGDHQNFKDFQNFGRSSKIMENCACLNLEVLGVPEGLVHSIEILEAPGVFLARRWRRC